MNIGELAKRSGLTPSRIRFYESIGLLKMVGRRPNGYRTYPSEALVLLELIATAQKAGFSLDEIRVLVPTDLENWQHDALLETLRRKVADIEALEARLAQSKKAACWPDKGYRGEAGRHRLRGECAAGAVADARRQDRSSGHGTS